MMPPDPENIVRLDVDWTGDEYEEQVRALRAAAGYPTYPTPEEKEAHERAAMNRQERRHGTCWEPPEKWRPR
jgi:hypothetical protein